MMNNVIVAAKAIGPSIHSQVAISTDEPGLGVDGMVNSGHTSVIYNEKHYDYYHDYNHAWNE